jgi:ribosomal protein S16
MPRDGRFIESVGTYDPLAESENVTVDGELVKDWMKKGAKPSEAVKHLLKRAGVVLEAPVVKKKVPEAVPLKELRQAKESDESERPEKPEMKEKAEKPGKVEGKSPAKPASKAASPKKKAPSKPAKPKSAKPARKETSGKKKAE